jgi:ATP synthase protein I
MTAEDPPPSVKDLDARLRDARLKEDQRLSRLNDQDGAGSSMGMAMKIAVEMISALIVSGAIGWFLDQWLDTRPWLMLAMLILGSATGLWNTYRTAMRMHRQANEDDQDDAKDDNA